MPAYAGNRLYQKNGWSIPDTIHADHPLITLRGLQMLFVPVSRRNYTTYGGVCPYSVWTLATRNACVLAGIPGRRARPAACTAI